MPTSTTGWQALARFPLRSLVWVLVAGWAIAFNAPTAQAAEADPSLRVVSFNIRYDNPGDGPNQWSNRREHVVETIREQSPDLLGIQEAVVHQHDYLDEQLSDYAAHGVGRADGLRESEFTTIFYRRDRFEKLTGGHFWLSETPHVPGSQSWDAALPRMASWLWLSDQQTGRELVLINTHWDHVGEEAREQSAYVIRQFIAGLPGALPVIVTGDFNRTEDHEPYRVMTEGREGHADRPLVDTYRHVYPNRSDDEATFNSFDGNEQGSRIDWVLASQDFEIADAAIDRQAFDGRYPSDHYPVAATLSLEPTDE